MHFPDHLDCPHLDRREPKQALKQLDLGTEDFFEDITTEKIKVAIIFLAVRRRQVLMALNQLLSKT